MPPLSLYIHYPWCLRKCPYCDFNSHARRPGAGASDSHYVDALLLDLADQYQYQSRPIQSIFIGGGTPSLLPGKEIARLLEAINRLVSLATDAEITLEANPGAVDAASFAAYRKAGVNRLSIGIQSLSDFHLRALGRVHDSTEALRAVEIARTAGFDNLNLDLIFGLPEQNIEQALKDLEQALALGPEHLSWYQLTLEPYTAFHQSPPPLPDDDLIAEMQEAGLELLANAGFGRYEVSAFAREGFQCCHNLNYWHFGDYLGIGAGAHGKLTSDTGQVIRLAKERGPERYLSAPTAFASETILAEADLVFEFMLNALRLKTGVPVRLFMERTGLGLEALESGAQKARALGLLEEDPEMLRATEFGFRFLNDLLGCFME